MLYEALAETKEEIVNPPIAANSLELRKGGLLALSVLKDAMYWHAL